MTLISAMQLLIEFFLQNHYLQGKSALLTAEFDGLREGTCGDSAKSSSVNIVLNSLWRCHPVQSVEVFGNAKAKIVAASGTWRILEGPICRPHGLRIAFEGIGAESSYAAVAAFYCRAVCRQQFNVGFVAVLDPLIYVSVHVTQVESIGWKGAYGRCGVFPYIAPGCHATETLTNLFPVVGVVMAWFIAPPISRGSSSTCGVFEFRFG